MARNRIIKPEFFTSEKLASISILSNLLFIGILIHCDDYGVCMNNNRRIIGDVFPLRSQIKDDDINNAKLELISIGVLSEMQYSGKKYLIATNWKEHQKVDKPSKRRYLSEKDMKIICETLKDEKIISYCISLGFSKETASTHSTTVSRNSIDTVNAPISNGNGNVNKQASIVQSHDACACLPADSSADVALTPAGGFDDECWQFFKEQIKKYSNSDSINIDKLSAKFEKKIETGLLNSKNPKGLLTTIAKKEWQNFIL